MLPLAREPDVVCAEGSQTSYMCGRCRVRLVTLSLLALRRGARAGSVLDARAFRQVKALWWSSASVYEFHHVVDLGKWDPRVKYGW
ncbi:hypothetical protein ABZ027_17170 [Streptomyces sp. NPDC006332]|uniref:hypothetical protein n=1 Tax=Streptomyces sp. NPDC006332 TaxID=3155456 RepID=UPI0033A5159F